MAAAGVEVKSMRCVDELKSRLNSVKENVRSLDENVKKLATYSVGRDASSAGGEFASLQRRPFAQQAKNRAPGSGLGRGFSGPNAARRGGLGAGGAFGRLGTRGGKGRTEDSDDPDDEILRKQVVQSSVVATPREEKSRQDMIAQQSTDTEGRARNRRMFGLLMGTLVQFKQEEQSKAMQEQKRKAVEQKLEVKQREEKEKEKANHRQLIENLRDKRRELRHLEAKMELVDIHNEWETQTRQLAYFIRTDSKPHIFFLPKTHTVTTKRKLEETEKALDRIIAERRTLLEEDIEELTKEDTGGHEDESDNEKEHPHDDVVAESGDTRTVVGTRTRKTMNRQSMISEADDYQSDLEDADAMNLGVDYESNDASNSEAMLQAKRHQETVRGDGRAMEVDEGKKNRRQVKEVLRQDEGEVEEDEDSSEKIEQTVSEADKNDVDKSGMSNADDGKADNNKVVGKDESVDSRTVLKKSELVGEEKLERQSSGQYRKDSKGSRGRTVTEVVLSETSDDRRRVKDSGARSSTKDLRTRSSDKESRRRDSRHDERRSFKHKESRDKERRDERVSNRRSGREDEHNRRRRRHHSTDRHSSSEPKRRKESARSPSRREKTRDSSYSKHGDRHGISQKSDKKEVSKDERPSGAVTQTTKKTQRERSTSSESSQSGKERKNKENSDSDDDSETKMKPKRTGSTEGNDPDKEDQPAKDSDIHEVKDKENDTTEKISDVLSVDGLTHEQLNLSLDSVPLPD